MIDMDAVSRDIETGRVELAASSKAILSLGTRRRIWRAMIDPQNDEASYRHRIELDGMCVRRGQHLWNRVFPGDNRIEEMLALAQKLVNQQINPKQAENRAEDFPVDVSGEVENITAPTQSAILIAEGAAHITISTCYRNPDYNTAEGDTADDELLPDSLDTSYCCASAAAGALNWMPIEKTDAPARRTFWTWYLDEAIPTVLAG